MPNSLRQAFCRATLGVLLNCGGLGCLILATPNYGQATPVGGGEMRVAISSDIRSTNPGVNRDGNTDTVLYHIVEPLVAFTDTLEVAPLLAERIDITDDGRLYTFTLRSGVSFHNGELLQAEHVVWTWQRLLDPATGFRCQDWYDGTGNSGLKIEAVEAVTPLTVEFRLNQPSALFLHRMANLQCLTGIIHPDSVASDGTWQQPIGTGPYKLDQWQRGKSVTLLRHQDYSNLTEPRSGLTGDKTPYIERLHFVVTPDAIAAQAALFSGAVDLLFAVPPAARHSVAARRDRKGDVVLKDYLTLDWTALLIAPDDPLLGKPDMRRAIAHALAHEQIAEFANLGMAPANASPVQVISPFYSTHHSQWLEYNPDKARQLAASAGYQGEPIWLQTNRKYSYMFDNAVAIQAMLQAAGFNVQLQVLDWASQLSHFFRGDFQLSSFGYSSRSHPALLFGTFTGDRSIAKSYQWDNDQARNLVGQLATATHADQQHLLDQLYSLMREQVPLIGLYNDHNTDVVRTRVRNYEPWAFGRPRLWGVWLENKGERP